MAEEQITEDTLRQFQVLFGGRAEIATCAPGRVNLIGEHTDYNSGLVLPAAIPLYTIACGKRNDLKLIRIRTLSADVDDPKTITIDLCVTKLAGLTKGSPKWANYILGILKNFANLDTGFDVLINSNVPSGAGLSSSASLEVAFFTFMEVFSKKSFSVIEKVLACQKAEHEFADVPCGIMDQMIVCLGKKDNALLINCKNNEHTLVPIDAGVKIVVINSKVKHDLSTGYADRKSECEDAASLLKVESLSDASLEKVNELPDIEKKRAHHVVTENDRTLKFIEFMRVKDYTSAGSIMLESHNSLRDDFEVSCVELDALVELALSIEGVYGSRMMGGGFGGCTISLVKPSSVDDMLKVVKSTYNHVDCYVFTPCDGVKVLELEN